MRRWTGAAACGLLTTAASAQLVFDGAVIDAAGRMERIGIASLRLQAGAEGAPGGGGVGGTGDMSVIDPRGSARTMRIGDALAIVPRSWVETTTGGPVGPDPWSLAGSPFIELVDGQRFIGRPGRIGAEGETIAWVHERFGTITLPIDEVARFVMRPGAAAAVGGGASGAGEDVKGDRIWLTNGDVLTGFLESVGPRTGGEGFALTIDTGNAGRVKVPVDQVIRASFANPRRTAAGPVAWLLDGSVVGLSAIATDASRAALLLTASAVKGAEGAASVHAAGTPEGAAMPTASFSSLEVNAIGFDCARVHPLAQLPIAAHRPLGLPRRPGPRVEAIDSLPAPLGAADVVLPGPMEVEWVIPAGASRLIGAARLDEADAMWGECVVVVEIVPGTGAAREPSRELSRVSLGGSMLSAPLAAELGAVQPGDRLRIRVEAGELGPIRDHVRLERVLLLR